MADSSSGEFYSGAYGQPGFQSFPKINWSKIDPNFKPIKDTKFSPKNIPFSMTGMDTVTGKRDVDLLKYYQSPTAGAAPDSAANSFSKPLGELEQTVATAKALQEGLMPGQIDAYRQLSNVALKQGVLGTAALMPLQTIAGQIATNRALQASKSWFDYAKRAEQAAQITALQQSGRLAASQGFAAELEAVSRAQDAATNAAINRYYRGPSY